jgi:hypothetical protein
LPGFTTEHTTLECWCGNGHDCPSSLAEAVAGICEGEPSSLSLVAGCGLIALRYSNLTASDRVFDAATGVLLGVAEHSDSTSRPCRTSSTFAGVEFDCPGAVECALCDGTEPRLGCE